MKEKEKNAMRCDAVEGGNMQSFTQPTACQAMKDQIMSKNMNSKRKFSDFLNETSIRGDGSVLAAKAVAFHEQNEVKQCKDQIENLNSILQMKNSLIEVLQAQVNQLEAKLVRYEGSDDAALDRSEFLALPFDAVAKILTEFLTMEDIAKLDSAFCVHSAGRRKLFLNILSTGTFHGHSSDDRACGKSYLKWLALRKVTVRMLNLKYCNDHFLGVIAKFCGNVLESLVLRNSKFTNEGIKRILPCLPSLKKLMISSSRRFTSVGLNYITKKCPLLEIVHFTDQYFSSLSLEMFAAGCPLLQRYDIRGCERILPIIAEKIRKLCPLLSQEQFYFDMMHDEEGHVEDIIHAIMLGVQHAHAMNPMPDDIFIGIHGGGFGQHNIQIVNGGPDMPAGWAEFLHQFVQQNQHDA